MATKPEGIHLVYNKWGAPACGQKRIKKNLFATLSWDEVTCKSCLRYRS